MSGLWTMILMVATVCNLTAAELVKECRLGAEAYGVGDFNTAEEHYLKAANDLRSKKDEKQLATVLTNLGAVYNAEKDYKKAVDVLADACKLKNSNLGLAHPSTIDSTQHLARALRKLGRDKEADELTTTVERAKRAAEARELEKQRTPNPTGLRGLKFSSADTNATISFATRNSVEIHTNYFNRKDFSDFNVVGDYNYDYKPSEAKVSIHITYEGSSRSYTYTVNTFKGVTTLTADTYGPPMPDGVLIQDNH